MRGKPSVEVWHGDKRMFHKEFRSGYAARQEVRSRVSDLTHLGLTVTAHILEDGWEFCCSGDGVDITIRIQYAGVSS